MRLNLLEGVRTLQWSGHHPSHASGITDTLIETPPSCPFRLTLADRQASHATRALPRLAPEQLHHPSRLHPAHGRLDIGAMDDGTRPAG